MPITVEVVDDHALFADAMGSVISEDSAFSIAGIAVTGSEAISIAQNTQPDVVLLDYHLPGYQADQLIPLIRRVSPRSRIVILTSDTTDATAMRAVQAGADGYLTKDDALDDVAQLLRLTAGMAAEAERKPVPEPEPPKPPAPEPQPTPVTVTTSEPPARAPARDRPGRRHWRFRRFGRGGVFARERGALLLSPQTVRYSGIQSALRQLPEGASEIRLTLEVSDPAVRDAVVRVAYYALSSGRPRQRSVVASPPVFGGRRTRLAVPLSPPGELIAYRLRVLARLAPEAPASAPDAVRVSRISTVDSAAAPPRGRA